MIKRRTLLSLVFALLASQAYAQAGINQAGEPCAPITDMLNAAAKSGEHVVFEGATRDHYKFYVTSDAKGAWTLLMANNHPGHGGLVPQACIKASNLTQLEGSDS